MTVTTNERGQQNLFRKNPACMLIQTEARTLWLRDLCRTCRKTEWSYKRMLGFAAGLLFLMQQLVVYFSSVYLDSDDRSNFYSHYGDLLLSSCIFC